MLSPPSLWLWRFCVHFVLFLEKWGRVQAYILHDGKHNTKNITVRLQFYVRITGNFWTFNMDSNASVKRVAIWAAVSSLPQAKKISLEDQLRVGREHVARHGAYVVAELVVPGESRDIVLYEDACRRINAYATLDGLISTKAIDVLVFLDRSRLGRTAALSMAVAELCNRAGILLYETESPLPSLDFRTADHSDMLIGAIKSVDAQQEIRKIQDRHRKGMADRVAKGKMPGKVNYGWSAVHEAGRLTGYAIDEDAAATVRLIVSLYLDNGFGALNIADHLNRIGRPAPAGGQAPVMRLGNVRLDSGDKLGGVNS